MINNVNYLVLSDLHLGNNKNKTNEIINNLDIYFHEIVSQLKLDLIFLAGDVFDRLLDCSSLNYYEIIEWFCRLMIFCDNRKIKLRILEGTPSHDWKQCRIIPILAKKITPNCDIRYIDTLLIEYIQDIDFYVLYVPDEWNSSYSETYKQVKNLLKMQGINKVDIAIMHGQFNYQLPNVSEKVERHNEEDYLSIVKYFISPGHIHTFSIYNRIIAQGSFDRMAHGEEEAKGGVHIKITKDSVLYNFLENKKAKKFITIKLKSLDVDKSLNLIRNKISKIPINSHIKLKADKNHPLLVNFDDTKKRFLDYYLTKQTLEDDDYVLIKEPIFNINYVPININKENIEELLLNNILSNYNLDENNIIKTRKLLREAL